MPFNRLSVIFFRQNRYNMARKKSLSIEQLEKEIEQKKALIEKVKIENELKPIVFDLFNYMIESDKDLVKSLVNKCTDKLSKPELKKLQKHYDFLNDTHSTNN